VMNVEKPGRGEGLTLRFFPLALVVFVLTLLGGCQQTRSAGGVTRSSAVPDFVQEGKVYRVNLEAICHCKVRVLKIRSDGWVQVQPVDRVLGYEGAFWCNIAHVATLEEVEDQEVHE
jgi:hypothetical protein